ncbi:MAG TPA: hypothetical protein PKA63_06395 [Oligoflexia bacterium]|nr:hypothetical protein [Oligoflexia bacterium]HMP48278.1 hypothetical protein [Oligoflexia bacterium]
MDETKKINLDERGSLSLEHILFIGAVVLIGAGLGAFYTNLGGYFQNVQLGNPTNVGNFNPTGGAGGGG